MLNHTFAGMRTSVKALSLGGCALVLASLTGCDPLPNSEPGRVSFSNVDGALVMAACESIDASSITLSWIDSENGEEGVAWKADGELSLETGDQISSSSVPAGLADSVWGPVLLPQASKVILETSNSGLGILVNVVVPDDFTEASGWLNSDGTVSAMACPEGAQASS